MSDSVWSHKQQPTRHPRPWDSSGKNSGVGCHSFSNAWKWKVKVKSLSHVQFSDPMDCSLPGSSVRGIFQARVLEWVAIAFSGKKLTISQMSAASTIGLVNQWVYSVEYFVTNKKCLWGKYLNNVQWKKGYTYLVGLLQEGGPLPGPNTELLSNTWKWIVQGDTC